MVGGIMSIQTAMDLIVAGLSLMIGFGLFALISSVLCSVAFFHHLNLSPSDPTVLTSRRR